MQTDPSAELLVVDASIAAKWYLPDEADAEAAREVLGDIGAHRIRLIEPAHFKIEVANAIRNAARSRRITEQTARQELTNLLNLPIQTVSLEDLLAAGFESALRYGCALYDALYLALAEQAACPMLHADQRLHNTLAGRFPHELWIHDYVMRR